MSREKATDPHLHFFYAIGSIFNYPFHSDVCNTGLVNKIDHPPLEQVASCCDAPDYHEPVEPTFAPELRPGFVLDERFVLEKPISRSGMATIYKARDTDNENQIVAVKVPHLSYEADPVFFSRFQREEQIGLKLNHPFILRFLPTGDHKSRPYIVTEYLFGCTLAHILGSTRPLPEKDALKLASLLGEALQYLHEQGVIHRDLKPSNVMICCDRTIRLMDFGIASDSAARRITMVGFTSVIGTPDYMAPEQVRNKRADERTDIYGLGAVLYEMITGSVPFQNENPWVAMNDRLTGDPVAPRKLNPGLSPQAEEIVLHAMQRDPVERYQSAAAMKAELDAPSAIRVTGYCNRLEAPRWRIGFRETPIIAGTLLALGFIAVQVLLFFLLTHHLARK
jgi:serine/threonine protein kinase